MDTEHKQTKTTQLNKGAGPQVVDDHASGNVDSIHYEDGKIQKKVYGGADPSSTRDLIVHTVERTKQTVQSYQVKVEPALTVQQFTILLQQKIKIALNSPQIKSKLDGEKFSTQQQISTYLTSNSEQSQQIFIFYDQTKAIIKKMQTQINYEPITKYSFIDDKAKVKVYLQLEGIGKVPAENIISRFLEWSIQIKIHDYKGKNWIFAVPKTQCIVRPKQSKVIQKQNKLIISIGKNAENDNWFSLYKVKCVGEKDD